jgi:hypothetical protein
MNRSTVSAALALLLALTLPLAGCNGGGGGSKSSSSSSAGVSSNTGGTSSAAPDPGGVVAPLGTAATAVSASASLGAYQAFGEHTGISDLAVPDVAGLRDRAFAVEESGTVRVLDLSGTTPRLDRSIPLAAAPFQPGIATGALSILDEHTALVTTSGQGGEAVYMFDPSTARATADVRKYDLSALTVTWPAGTTNSKGVDVGGRALPVTFTAGAVLSSDRLLVASSNLDANYDLNPGTVISFDRDPATGALSHAALIRTTDFDPTALTRVATPRGDLVLVTNTGAFGAGPSSIDIIESATLRFVGTIPLGARNAGGPVVVSPDGRRGYVASQSSAEVYVLDLTDIGDEVQNQAAKPLPGRYLGGYALPATGPVGYVSGLALSRTGNYLYAVNFNASELIVVDLASPGYAARVVGFARTGDVSNYEGLASKVAVRPGVPGVDFQGPSILVATVNLAAADQTVTNVKSVLDAVTVDRD